MVVYLPDAISSAAVVREAEARGVHIIDALVPEAVATLADLLADATQRA